MADDLAKGYLRVVDENVRLRIENTKLLTALTAIMELDGEINPNNYDDCDVSKLNNAFIEAFYIARAALAEAPQERIDEEAPQGRIDTASKGGE